MNLRYDPFPVSWERPGVAAANRTRSPGPSIGSAPNPAPLSVRTSRLGEWFSVPVIDGAFIVNGGELLELASGGAFLATTHRVQATGADVGRPRLSLCFFHNPGFKAVVRPIPKLPVRLATAAAANREVRSAAAAAGEGLDLYGEEPRPYGESALRGYLRSLPHIFKLHHPDMILAETAQAKL